MQPSLSLPIASIVISPEVFDSRNRPTLSSPALPFSSLMRFGQRNLSNSTPPSALPSAQISNCGDGQFSDAESEADEDIKATREKKRLKIDCSRPTERDCSQSTCLATRRGTSSTLHVTTQQHQGDGHPGDSVVKEVASSGPVRKSGGGKIGVSSNSSSSKTRSTTVTSNQSSSSSSNTNTSTQLPEATRRLAMLVGIPESSQAIIHSTLSLPSNRLNAPCRTHSHSNATPFRHIPSASTSKQRPDATTPLPRSNRSTGSVHGGKPVNSPSRVQTISSCINPILSAENNGRSSSRSSSHVTANETSSNTLPHSNRNSRSHRQTSSLDVKTHAPSTFSMLAPSSSQPVRSFGPPPPSALSESTNRQLNKCEEGFKIDSFSQSPSTYRATSLDGSTTHTDLTAASAVTDGAQSRKRKARAKKQNPGAQAGQNENIPTEVELVKPPPTINGKVSHARKVLPGYAKRTPNSFLMFRSHVIANKLLPPGVENDNRQISRVVSGLWSDLSEEDLRSWQEASRQLRAAARANNPGLKHAPNQKRSGVIRRRRHGQLPGETPEQRVEREKAAAAAVAKVMIESRGEKIEQGKLKQPASTSTKSSVSNASITTSRPEFRAPTYGLNNSTQIQARSEYAESTLTTSPIPDPGRSLSCVPELQADVLLAHQTPLTPKTMTSGPSTGKSLYGSYDSNDRSPRIKPAVTVHQVQENQQKLDITTNLLDRISPEIMSQQPLISPISPPPSKNPSYHPPQTELSSNIFLALGSTTDAPTQTFSDTFSNEMFRSLGLTAADLGLEYSLSGTLLPATASTMNDGISSNSSENHRPEEHSRIWSHEMRFSNPANFSPTQYPFRDSGITEGLSSQGTSISNDEGSCSTLDPLSQLENSNSLELSSLINDCYTEPLNCDGLDFDSLYLNRTPNTMANLDFEKRPHPFSSNLYDTHFSSRVDPSNSSLTNTLWDRNDS